MLMEVGWEEVTDLLAADETIMKLQGFALTASLLLRQTNGKIVSFWANKLDLITEAVGGTLLLLTQTTIFSHQR